MTVEDALQKIEKQILEILKENEDIAEEEWMKQLTTAYIAIKASKHTLENESRRNNEVLKKK